jgi:hypothetical protein
MDASQVAPPIDQDLIVVIKDLEIDLPGFDEEQARDVLCRMRERLARIRIPASLAGATLRKQSTLELSLPPDASNDEVAEVLVKAIQGLLPASSKTEGKNEGRNADAQD